MLFAKGRDDDLKNDLGPDLLSPPRKEISSARQISRTSRGRETPTTHRSTPISSFVSSTESRPQEQTDRPSRSRDKNPTEASARGQTLNMPSTRTGYLLHSAIGQQGLQLEEAEQGRTSGTRTETIETPSLAVCTHLHPSFLKLLAVLKGISRGAPFDRSKRRREPASTQSSPSTPCTIMLGMVSQQNPAKTHDV